MNFDEQLEYFKLYLKKQGKSSHTILSYMCSLRLFFSLYTELSIENLQSYRVYLLSHYKINTVNTRIHGINCFLNCLASPDFENALEVLLTPPSADSETSRRRDSADETNVGQPIKHINAEVLRSSSPGYALMQFRLEPLRNVSAPEPSSSSSIFSETERLSDSFSKSVSGNPQLLPCASVCAGTGSYRLTPVKKQQNIYLDTVISEKDYEKLKRRLKKDNKYFWYFVVRFLGATGARISELLQIKMENLKNGHLDLYSKGGKIRRLYLPRRLCDEALPWFESHGIKSGFIFLNRRGQVISARGVSIRLKQLAVQYKIDPDTVYPHSFRHRFAKNFLKKFNDISLLADLMGHDSIETTRIYLTRSSTEQKELLDKIITW